VERKGFTTLWSRMTLRKPCSSHRVIVFRDRPARIKADIAALRPDPRHRGGRGDPRLAGIAAEAFSAYSDWMTHGEVTTSSSKQRACEWMPRPCRTIARGRSLPNCARRRQHDRDAAFRSRI